MAVYGMLTNKDHGSFCLIGFAACKFEKKKRVKEAKRQKLYDSL